ncbi:MAG: transcriptional regulatory protein RtcR [Myxococcota bacterium]|jgi:transcriptional regulatory protein RtcR
MRTVVIGLLGTTLDMGAGPKRWNRWRPTVSLFQHDDLQIDRLDLIVPDARRSRTVESDITTLSPHTEVRLHELPFDDPWDFDEVYAGLHAFARGYSFDTEAERYLMHITTGTHVAQICLFLLTEARFLPGKLLQSSPRSRAGDADGPGYDTIDLDLARYDRIAQRFDTEAREASAFLKAGIETQNDAFNRLIDRIEQVAGASRAPILLTGPTGAGKSRLAVRIYELKKARRQLAGRLVEVNCATLRGDGAMSALFGHRRGAFTGAVTDRAGLLREADGGLLFLDEIAELGLDEQAMLLRAIEEKRFLPMGSEREVRSDFQLIAGTNRDLREAVATGRFREDLLARLDLWTFRLPGLAERREDIRPNLDYELEQFARENSRRVSFNAEARARFLAFAEAPSAPWRANFRDLNAAVVRMSTLAPGGRIGVEDVEEEMARLRYAWQRPGSTSGGFQVERVLGERAAELDRFDRVQLEDVLAVIQSAPSRSDAGRELFGVSRLSRRRTNDSDRLRKYLLKWELDYDTVRAMLTG